ncbi:MAG: Nif3-like dinuclear metal center hexameric protein [Oscillibacter sp.]|nr:Nif3-like dinuclear metal center hexameric protein [Oscillibacter sp.]
MPTVREIEQALFDLAPKDLAMEWDNVGHLVGEPDAEIENVLVALDVTDGTVQEAIDLGCTLLVSHHPVMNHKWHVLQSIRSDDPQQRLLMKLLRNGVSAICMHTNLDIASGGVNDRLALLLRLEDPGPLPNSDGVCRVGTLPSPVPLRDFVAFVAETLHCGGVRYADAGRPVSRVAVGGGSCADYAGAAIAAGCDTFVTGDLRYHEFLDGTAAGINLIDAGHFPTENPVTDVLAAYLKERFPTLNVKQSASHHDAIQYFVKGEH